MITNRHPHSPGTYTGQPLTLILSVCSWLALVAAIPIAVAMQKPITTIISFLQGASLTHLPKTVLYSPENSPRFNGGHVSST
jgi:hypothetical protein